MSRALIPMVRLLLSTTLGTGWAIAACGARVDLQGSPGPNGGGSGSSGTSVASGSGGGVNSSASGSGSSGINVGSGSGSSAACSGSGSTSGGSTATGVLEAGVTVMGIWDGGSPRVGGLCSASSAGATSCGCTRRQGAGNSFQCAMGVGEEVTASVGPSGGTVSLRRPWPAIDFRPTALAKATDITLIETAIAPPRDLLDWSPVYRIEPLGLCLAVPAPLTLPWANSSGTTASNLAIWFSPDGTCFTRVADSYTNAGFEEGSTTQLGYFIVAQARTAATAACP
jgi:hypothetical protein